MNKNILYAFILYFIFSIASAAVGQVNSDLEAKLQDIIKDKNAQIGIAVIINGKDTITVNNDTQYPLMSVFKFHQALAVANYLEQNKIPLTTPIYIRKTDLLSDTYSPLRDKYPQGDIYIAIGDLLAYTLQLSDNNACDILFKYIVGVKETDYYIRSLGIKDFSISATEEAMHRDLQSCYKNWTTPLEMAKLLEIFITQPILSDDYKSFIKHTMIESKTGKNRLISPLLTTNAIVGHKTGTGDSDGRGRIIGMNDVGFIFLPDGQRYTIAVFVRDSEESSRATEKIIADISKAVYQHIIR